MTEAAVATSLAAGFSDMTCFPAKRQRLTVSAWLYGVRNFRENSRVSMNELKIVQSDQIVQVKRAYIAIKIAQSDRDERDHRPAYGQGDDHGFYIFSAQ